MAQGCMNSKYLKNPGQMDEKMLNNHGLVQITISW